jgi:hypothetical protein
MGFVRADAHPNANFKRMDERFAGTSEDFAQKGLRYTKEQLDSVLTETENYVRAKPAQALLYALVAGYLLNRLPVARIATVLVRLVYVAVKPAVLVYGASKLYEAAQREE